MSPSLAAAADTSGGQQGGAAAYAASTEWLRRRGYACFNCACDGVLGLCNPVLQPLGDDVGAELGRLERLANRTPAYDAKGDRLPFWTDFLCTPMASWVF